MLSSILPPTWAMTDCTLSNAPDLAVTARHLRGLCLLNEEEGVFVQVTKSSQVGQLALDGARAVVGARAAVGVLAAARPVSARTAAARALPLATPPLVPPPLGPSSLPPSLPIPAPTKPAQPRPDISEGARQGENDQRAQERLTSPFTCALQKLSGSLVHFRMPSELSSNMFDGADLKSRQPKKIYVDGTFTDR
jgi:hypothetical protein